MALRLLTLFVSLGVHLAAALFMLVPAGGHAIEEGAGQDIMVVEQGIALEGVAKLGEDEVTVDEVDVQPTEMAMAVPEQVTEDTPEEVKPVEQDTIVASEAGPEQETAWKEPEEVEEIKPEEMKEPVEKIVKEKPPEEAPQPLPPQIAALEQEAVIAQHESSGAEKKGGSTTSQRAYLGKLRTHLEENKINPRTQIVGTALVQFTVNADGSVTSRKIVKSSGSQPLDEAALASIDKASPFPPIPQDIGRRTMQVSVPFKFTVR